jgi:hypothetical protein
MFIPSISINAATSRVTGRLACKSCVLQQKFSKLTTVDRTAIDSGYNAVKFAEHSGITQKTNVNASHGINGQYGF